MSSLVYERVHDNLNRLKLTTIESLLDNYLEIAGEDPPGHRSRRRRDRAGDPVLFINASVLVEELERYLKKLTQPGVLIIDEIGYLPFDAQAAYCFFQLISRRCEGRSTIFASNKTFADWGEIFQDHVIAAALLDRILHRCTTVNIRGESYRMKDRKKHRLWTDQENL